MFDLLFPCCSLKVFLINFKQSKICFPFKCFIVSFTIGFGPSGQDEGYVTDFFSLVVVDSQTRDMLRYSFGTLKCKNAIFLQKVNLVAALMQNYKQRNVSIKLDIKLNNRQTGTLRNCIHFIFKDHFTFSHWILIFSLDSFALSFYVFFLGKMFID